MSSYVKQYSNCQSVVQNALANGGGVKATGAGKGGGSSISTAVIVVIVVVVLAIAAFAGAADPAPPAPGGRAARPLTRRPG